MPHVSEGSTAGSRPDGQLFAPFVCTGCSEGVMADFQEHERGTPSGCSQRSLPNTRHSGIWGREDSGAANK